MKTTTILCVSPQSGEEPSYDTDIENRLVDTVGKGGWGELRNRIETITSPYVRWIASGNLLCDRESLNPLAVTPIGVGSWEVRGRFKREGRMYTYD